MVTMIHVARDGANIGSFSREEVREGLRTGRFVPTDMAWEEGMADWRPLSQVMADKTAAAMPASGPAGENALPISSSASSSGESGDGLPWEHREELGLVKAFFDTVIVLLTKPAEAFGMMKTEGGLIDPLLFALIGGSAGTIVSFLLESGLRSVGFMANRESPLFGLGTVGVGLVFALALVPVMVVVVMFLVSGVLHLCLMIVGGAKKPFETTFRVVCFSCGATYLLSMIPFCGSFITLVWSIVLECMGLARAHETEISKAIMAVVLPMIVCCGGVILITILGGVSLLGLFSTH